MQEVPEPLLLIPTFEVLFPNSKRKFWQIQEKMLRTLRCRPRFNTQFEILPPCFFPSQSGDSVQLALKLDGTKLEGRSVRVKRSVKKEKQKNKPDSKMAAGRPGKGPAKGRAKGPARGPGQDRGGSRGFKKFFGKQKMSTNSSGSFSGEKVDPNKKPKKKGLKKKVKPKKAVHI